MVDVLLHHQLPITIVRKPMLSSQEDFGLPDCILSLAMLNPKSAPPWQEDVGWPDCFNSGTPQVPYRHPARKSLKSAISGRDRFEKLDLSAEKAASKCHRERAA